MTKEYIISGEQLQMLHYRKKKNPDNSDGRNHGAKYLPIGYYEIDGIIKDVEFRPYNPEAEKAAAVNGVLKKAQLAINHCYINLIARRTGTFRWDSSVSLKAIDEEFGKLQEDLRQQAGTAKAQGDGE